MLHVVRMYTLTLLTPHHPNTFAPPPTKCKPTYLKTYLLSFLLLLSKLFILGLFKVGIYVCVCVCVFISVKCCYSGLFLGLLR